MRYHEIKRYAKALREGQTPSERILWSYLRRKQLGGRKFLRQHPIIYESKNNHHWCFIPDFYCREERLIIELDGAVHYFRKKEDMKRDRILKSRGYRILRIANDELEDIDHVLNKIQAQFSN